MHPRYLLNSLLVTQEIPTYLPPDRLHAYYIPRKTARVKKGRKRKKREEDGNILHRQLVSSAARITGSGYPLGKGKRVVWCSLKNPTTSRRHLRRITHRRKGWTYRFPQDHTRNVSRYNSSFIIHCVSREPYHILTQAMQARNDCNICNLQTAQDGSFNEIAG